MSVAGMRAGRSMRDAPDALGHPSSDIRHPTSDMHPAYSVIFFTTASGAGYGLLALLGVMGPLGLLPIERWFGAAAIALSLTMVTAGLVASMLHLGHPERAWRAVSQIRTSWLSREGLAALLAYLPALAFASGWVLFASADGIFALAGYASAILAVVTVWCTGMIYASLRPIRQWHNGLVVPVYFALALMTGALWLAALAALFGLGARPLLALAVAAIVIAGGVKWRYWRIIDAGLASSTPETATGLIGGGRVRSLDPPNTAENYLQKEMGFAIARKHAAKLRRVALIVGFAAPLALALAGLAAGGTLAAILAPLAAVSAMFGVLIERWLFFAEATHTVTLYYGASKA